MVNNRSIGLVVGGVITACANVFGVGELTPGAGAGGDASAGDGTLGGESGAASTTGGTQAATAGASGAANLGGKSNLASGGGSAGTTTSRGGSSNTAAGGQASAAKGGATQSQPPEAGSTSSAGAAGEASELTPPSCEALAETCGTAAATSRNCCATQEVKGGSFYRSYDKLTGEEWDQPSAPATIRDFHLDSYEVTVGRFRRFVALFPLRLPAGIGRNPQNPSDTGWNDEWSASLPSSAAELSAALRQCNTTAIHELSTWTPSAGQNEALPINCVTWFEAFAFCALDGGRLPSEAEWNYAAAGGSQARVYPWPSTLATDIDANHAVYAAPIAAVGSKLGGNGLFGQSDLAGNVWEWTVDWYQPEYGVPCDNCAELAQGEATGRVLRGGGYYNQPVFLRSAERGQAVPTTRDTGYGLRCARDVGVDDWQIGF